MSETKAVCPKDKRHTSFHTPAHVVEEWEVDAFGNLVKVVDCLNVTAGPDKRNVWKCATCGAEAVFEPVLSSMPAPPANPPLTAVVISTPTIS